MAIDMDKQIQDRLKNHPNIKFRRLTSKLRWLFRAVLKRMPAFKNPTLDQYKFEHRSIFDFQNDLKQRGYAFIPNFLSSESYQHLIKNWPKTRYFAPIGSREKSKTSDKGLWCTYGKPQFDINRNATIWSLYKMFLSTSFMDDVKILAGDDVDRMAYHLLSQRSFWGSGLAPHRDSKDSVHLSKINFIYFVESNGEGWESGGTSIFKSNNYDEPVFIPKELNNSCLFYYSDSELFHGFPPIKFGKYRKNVIAHFCAKL